MAIITGIDIDLSDIKQVGEIRKFAISGSRDAMFSLELTNDDATKKYYNFKTNLFQSTPTRLKNIRISGGVYTGSITCPTAAPTDRVNGAVTSGVKVIMDTAVASVMEVGDRVTGNAALDAANITVVALDPDGDNDNEFSLSSATAIADGEVLTFTAANKYDLLLFAERNPILSNKTRTKHTKYHEVKFSDGSIDINSSTGSRSNLIQKVIYQTLDVDITIKGHSPNSDITHQGSIVTQTITASRSKNNVKIPFSIPWTVTNTKTLTIDRQPKASDIATYVTRVVGIDPVSIPSENISKVTSGSSTTNGTEDGTSADAVIDATVTDVLAIGDRVIGPNGHAINDLNLTVISHDGSNTFTCDQNFPVTGDEITLTFSNQKNYKWSLDNVYGLTPNMRIYATDTTGTANGFTEYATIKDYLTQITVFEGEREEYKINDVDLIGIETHGVKPTITRDSSTHVITTTLPGDIVFNQQANNAFGGKNVDIYGYGRSEINSLTEYDIEFSDLRVVLTGVTTTTTTAPSASATFDVTSAAGIAENVSSVSGIGISSGAVNPTVTRIKNLASGTYTTGSSGYPAGELTLSAAQTLESGITLTFGGASTIATITGNMKINKVGNSDVTIYFDLERFLTMNAAPTAV